MIQIIDSIMGSGKTTWAIRFMNEHPQNRYIYITPYLQEAERIAEACPKLHFRQPTETISKQASFFQLLKQGERKCRKHGTPNTGNSIE